MEFFRTLNIKTDAETIQKSLALKNLDAFSTEFFILGSRNEQEAQIGGIWGEFTLSRSKINGGLRFALLECPNGLAWTVTTGFSPAKDSIIIHLTINRSEQDEMFLDEISAFLDDHSECLKNHCFRLSV
jgi:hypothetical protein